MPTVPTACMENPCAVAENVAPSGPDVNDTGSEVCTGASSKSNVTVRGAFSKFATRSVALVAENVYVGEALTGDPYSVHPANTNPCAGVAVTVTVAPSL